MTSSYMSTAEASAKLGIDQNRIRFLCRQGRFPGAYKHPDSGNWLIPRESISAIDIHASSKKVEVDDHEGGKVIKSGDIHIGDVNRSTMAVGPGARVNITRGSQKNQINVFFDQIYERIESRPADTDVDKQEISETVQNIQTEVVKSDRANVNKVERWLKTLALMAPDIFEVTVATLTNPITGLGTAIRKIAEKARLESGTSS
jgi:hypothetical protein